jgi:hypothetical protein
MTCSATAQQDPYALLDRVQASYQRVNDYKVEIEATVAMQGLSVPKMKATMYFKKPDKVHIESDGFAMLPRDAVGFNPATFRKDEYDAVIQGEESIRGTQCVKLKLLARADSIRLQRATLFVDATRDLVLRMDADPGEGASVQADFTYKKFNGKYWLPESIEIVMASPMRFRSPNMKKQAKGEDSKATVSIRYRNYVVNKGLSDSLFENKKMKK